MPNPNDFPPGYPQDLIDIYFEARGLIEELFQRLKAGTIALSEWRAAMESTLAEYNSIAIMTGADSETLNEALARYSEESLARQLDYLGDFYDEIDSIMAQGGSVDPATGEVKIPWDQWFKRAGLYSSSVIENYWVGDLADWPIPAVPGDGSSQCGEFCRCHVKKKIWDAERGDADLYWVLEPGAEHCQTCLERAAAWSPLKIRGFELLLPDYELMKEMRDRIDDLVFALPKMARSTPSLAGTLQKALAQSLKGGPGSGNFEHAGIMGHLGGSAPSGAANFKIIGDKHSTLISSQTQDGLKQGGVIQDKVMGLSYLIMPDGRLIGSKNTIFHENLVGELALYEPGKLGISKEKVTAIQDDWKKGNIGSYGIYEAVLAGAMRVRAAGKEIAIQTKTMNRGMLRKIQEYYYDRKLGLPETIKWDSIDPIYGRNFIESSIQDFLQSNGIKKTISGHLGLKEQKLLDAFQKAMSESLKGGPGSGNFRHLGRPGKVGGSTTYGQPHRATYEAVTQNPNFQKFFKGSKVVDAQGRPLVVYHGTPTHGEFSNNKYVQSEQEGEEYPEFTSFRTDLYGITDSGWLGAGSYFTPDPDFAWEFGNKLIPAYVALKNPFIYTDEHSSGESNNFRFMERLQGLEGLPEELKLDFTDDFPKKTKRQPGDYLYEKYKFEYESIQRLTDKDGKNPAWYRVSGFSKDFGSLDFKSESKREVLAKYHYAQKHGGDKWAFPNGFPFSIITKIIGSKEFKDLLIKNGYDGVIQKNTKGEIDELVAYYPSQIKSAIGNQGTYDPNNPSILKERIAAGLVTALKGGAGSGNFRHSGRPGKVGGSQPQAAALPLSVGQIREKFVKENAALAQGREALLQEQAKFDKEFQEVILPSYVESGNIQDKKMSGQYVSPQELDTLRVNKRLQNDYATRSAAFHEKIYQSDAQVLELTRKAFGTGNTLAPGMDIQLPDNPYWSEDRTRRIDQGIKDVFGFVSPSLAQEIIAKGNPPDSMNITGKFVSLQLTLRNTSSYKPEDGTIYIVPEPDGHEQYRAITHEMGHWIDARLPRNGAGVIWNYREKRTKGQVIEEYYPKGTTENNACRPDKFFSRYMGFQYPGIQTEILSKGIELITTGKALEFAGQDPETFDFVINVLRGNYG